MTIKEAYIKYIYFGDCKNWYLFAKNASLTKSDNIEKEITLLFNDQKYNVVYQFENSILYCQIVIDNILSGDDKERIENLNSDKFYIDISLDNEKTYISIHKKSFY